MNERYIADTSALARMKVPSVAAALGPLLAAGEVATCAMVEMEVLFSALGANELDRTLSRRKAAFRRIPIEQADFDRAIEVMAMLARRAELAVMHYDEDFDRIGAITGQPTRWVVPRGSL